MLARWRQVAFAAALLGWLAAGAAAWGAEKPLQPATEVFAVDPALVRELSCQGAGWRLAARRAAAGEPFTLVVLRSGEEQPDVCRSGAGFDRVLEALTSLKLHRTPEAREVREYEARYPRRAWVELLIRDASALEPFRARLLPLPGSPGDALLQFAGVSYLIALDDAVFRLLEGGCASLGANGPPH